MNTLSWLIYAAEIFDRLGVALAAAGFGLILAGFAALAGGHTVWTYFSWQGKDERDRGAATQASLRKWGPRAVVLAAFLFLGAILLPSSRTLWLIAASEAGEAVVTSPDAVEMMGDLKAIIKKRLKDELGGEGGK